MVVCCSPSWGVEQAARRAQLSTKTVRRMHSSLGLLCMNSEPAVLQNHGLRKGVHFLTAFLLVVIVLASVRLPSLELLAMIGLASGFGAVYYAGNRHLRDPLALQLWLLALTCIWIIMVPIQTSAVYLVFALYFLYLQVLTDFRGIIAVIGATVVSVLSLPRVHCPSSR